MIIFNEFLISLDRHYDYFPYTSTLTNLVDLFIKTVVIPRLDDSQVSNSHYFTHIKKKSFTRCLILLVPFIGNLFIFFIDIMLMKVKFDRLNAWYADPSVEGDKSKALWRIKVEMLFVNFGYNWLNLSNLGLNKLPAEIWQDRRLKFLYLDNNKLTSIPGEIGQLTNLKWLQLNNNRLTSLPTEIGNLKQLEGLVVHSNPDFRDLPMTLGQIPSLNCLIPPGTARMIEQAEAILQQCRAMRNADVDTILPARLKKWKALARSRVDITHEVEALSQAQKIDINEWLHRLEQTKDFAKHQSALAGIVYQILEDALQNKTFQEPFFSQVEANLVCCEDRAAMSLNEIYTSWKIMCRAETLTLSQKLELLTGAAKTLRLRKEIAGRIDRHQKETDHIEHESVEIFLYYETHLKGRLGLLTAIQNMISSVIGKRDWIEENSVMKSVQDNFFEDLYELPPFQKLLSEDRGIQKRWTEIDAHFNAQLSDCPPGGEFDEKVLEHQHRQGEIMVLREKKKMEIAKEWYQLS